MQSKQRMATSRSPPAGLRTDSSGHSSHSPYPGPPGPGPQESALRVFNWSRILRDHWWLPDPGPPPADPAAARPVGWLPPDRIAGLILEPVQAGPCSRRNTTLSRDLQERAVDNLAQILAFRTQVTNQGHPALRPQPGTPRSQLPPCLLV